LTWLLVLFPVRQSVSCFVNNSHSVEVFVADSCSKGCTTNTPFAPCLCSLNLYELIKKNNYNGFSMSLIRRFCNSIVKCLRLLYKENIIHCDLKPVSTLDSIVTTIFNVSSIGNRKISCSNSVVAAPLKSSTLAAHATWIAKSIRTSNRGSIAPRRWFSACNTAQPSICGAWVSVSF